MTTEYTDPSSEMSAARLNQWETMATRIAKAVVAELPLRSGGDERALPAGARAAQSLFSELRFALGTNDSATGKAKKMLPFYVTDVESTGGKGKIKYKRQTLADLGAKVLTIAYRSGDLQVHNVPTTGDEIPITLDRTGAIAVTLWDDVYPMGAAILVSFVTY